MNCTPNFTSCCAAENSVPPETWLQAQTFPAAMADDIRSMLGVATSQVPVIVTARQVGFDDHSGDAQPTVARYCIRGGFVVPPPGFSSPDINCDVTQDPAPPLADFACCGDEFVEAGEHCDEGDANGTSTSCCDANCQFKLAGTTCAQGICDGQGHCGPVPPAGGACITCNLPDGGCHTLPDSTPCSVDNAGNPVTAIPGSCKTPGCEAGQCVRSHINVTDSTPCAADNSGNPVTPIPGACKTPGCEAGECVREHIPLTDSTAASCPVFPGSCKTPGCEAGQCVPNHIPVVDNSRCSADNLGNPVTAIPGSCTTPGCDLGQCNPQKLSVPDGTSCSADSAGNPVTPIPGSCMNPGCTGGQCVRALNPAPDGSPCSVDNAGNPVPAVPGSCIMPVCEAGACIAFGGANNCANPLLGSASACTVFEADGATVTLSGRSVVNGSVCIQQNGRLAMSGNVKVSGNVELAAGATVDKSGASTTGPVNQGVDLTPQITAAERASSAAAALCSSFVGSVARTQTITGTGGTTELCLQNIHLSGGEIVTLTGPPGTTFVINVEGDLALSGGSKIVVGGSVQPSDVFINVVGPGSDVILGGGAVLQGSVLALQRRIDLVGSSTVGGQIISRRNITMTGGSETNCPCTP